jgi:hypothetical protein
MYKWFKSNLLPIHLSETDFIQFKTKNTVSTNTILACNNIVISDVSYIKFPGLIIDDALSWNLHIDKAMKKVTSVCYMIRAVKPCVIFFSKNNLSFPISLCANLWYCILGNIFKLR